MYCSLILQKAYKNTTIRNYPYMNIKKERPKHFAYSGTLIRKRSRKHFYSLLIFLFNIKTAIRKRERINLISKNIATS